MSNGGNLPYQLRPNKAVERLLFCELLERLDPNLGISGGIGFDYVGFGGPQMEDFRLLHDQFPKIKMISIEKDKGVMKRQKFNGPHTNVSYRNQSSGEFIGHFRPRNPVIVWLDYTSPSQRPQQIQEFQELLRRVPESSIVKITLNASASSLPGKAENGLSLQQARLKSFLNQFDRFFPTGLQEEDVTGSKFPLTLLRVIEYASSEAFRDRRDWRFQSLMSAIYADGQEMLTVTGLVGNRHRVENIVDSRRITEWFFTRLQWAEPVKIDVPELTMKERIYINQLLPKYESDVARIEKKLGFTVDPNLVISEQKLQHYVDFHKHYPQFSKVTP